MDDPRAAILSRRARFVAAALAAAGLATTLHHADAASDAGTPNDADASTSDATRPPSPPTAAALAAARALVRDAMELRRAGDHAGAVARFRRAYELSRNPKLFFYIAQESEAVGDYAGAIDAYQKLTTLTASERNDAGLPNDIAKRIADLEAKVGRVTITTADGAVVSIDGHDIGTTPLASSVLVNPGTHRIRVQFADRRPVEREITIVEGASTTIAITADEAAPYPCLQPPPMVCLSPPMPRNPGCGCETFAKKETT